jgi:DNA-binding IclR family transcriptional regulator
MSRATVNENFEPTGDAETVLDAFKKGREANRPWGRHTPRSIHEETGISKGNVEFYLRELTNAGWIRRYTRGLYEFVIDPREPTSD